MPSHPRAPSACPLQSINAPRVLLTLPYLSLPCQGSSCSNLPAASANPHSHSSSTHPFLILYPCPSYLWSLRVTNPTGQAPIKDSMATAWLCEETGDLPQGHWGELLRAGCPSAPCACTHESVTLLGKLPAEPLSMVPSHWPHLSSMCPGTAPVAVLCG